MKPNLQDFLQIAHVKQASCSPDGRHVAYLSDASGVAQLYIVEVATPENVTQLTDFREPVQFAMFSPVANQIAFGMARGGDERMQIFVIDVDSREVSSVTNLPLVIHRWGGWSPDGQWVTYASNGRTGDDFDVYVHNVRTNESRCVFAPGGWCDSVGFSATGRYVIGRVQHTLHTHDMHVIDLQNNDAVTHITPHDGVAEYEEPRWLPGDTAVIYSGSTNREFMGLECYDMQSRTRTTVYAPEHDITDVALHPDGRTVMTVVNEDGYPHMQLIDLSSGALVESKPFDSMICELRWMPTGEQLLCVAEDTTSPSSISLWSPTTGESRVLVDVPPHASRTLFVEPRLLDYPSFDGLRIPFFVFEPHDAPAGGPAIVLLHGGPESQFGAGFHPLVQYFVACGYRVFAPNIRGSRGYGKRFLALDDKEKRMDSIRDLESLHAFVVANGLADAHRIALMGGSYGGYMTLAGLAFQPQLWAAGIDTVGMSNLVTFLQRTASWRRRLREQEYGSLDTDRELLESLSPLHAIDAIRAPLFVIHGANDPRVPLAEAEQIVEALHQRGRIAELLVYADEGHGLHKFVNRMDAYTRVTAFCEQYVRGAKES